jgi:ATP/maltotriose-dependent transcriptional regulator MalT
MRQEFEVLINQLQPSSVQSPMVREHLEREVELTIQRLRSLLDQYDSLGFAPLADEVRQALLGIERRGEQPNENRNTPVPSYQDSLTPREVSVLKLLAEGMSVREVGESLFISVNTVKTHAKNINVKLGACRRTQAISCAKAMGILA